MKNNPQWKLSVATNGDKNIAIDWWLSGKTMNEYFSNYDFNGSSKKGWTKTIKKTQQLKINLVN